MEGGRGPARGNQNQNTNRNQAKAVYPPLVYTLTQMQQLMQGLQCQPTSVGYCAMLP